MPRDEDFEQLLESFQRTGFIVMKPNFAPLSIKKWFSKHTSSGSKKDSLVYCKLYVTVWCILLSLVGIISSLFTLLNERVELNYCWACTNLVYHLKISAFSPSLEFYLFKKKFSRNFTKKFHQKITKFSCQGALVVITNEIWTIVLTGSKY